MNLPVAPRLPTVKGVAFGLLLAAMTTVTVAEPDASQPPANFTPRFWITLLADYSKHPLSGVIKQIIAGQTGAQPSWKLPLLVQGLQRAPQRCSLSAYCPRDRDGGDSCTAWGTRVRRGIIAADRRHWGPGSVIWIGSPVNQICIVEDVGGAVLGKNRFDVCLAGGSHDCWQFGRPRGVEYVPLYRTPPRRHWGRRPAGWQPPVLNLERLAERIGLETETKG